MRDFVFLDAGFDRAIILSSTPLLPFDHPAIEKTFDTTGSYTADDIRRTVAFHADETWEKNAIQRYIQDCVSFGAHNAYDFGEKLALAVRLSQWIVQVDTFYYRRAIHRLIAELEAECATLENTVHPSPDDSARYTRNRKDIHMLRWVVAHSLPANISPTGIWMPGDLSTMLRHAAPGFLESYYENDGIGETEFRYQLNSLGLQSEHYASARYAANLVARGHTFSAMVYSLKPIGGGSGNYSGGGKAAGVTGPRRDRKEAAETTKELFVNAPKLHSLGNREAREWYLAAEKTIPGRLNPYASLERQARHAHWLRNQIRTRAREIMSDRAKANELYAKDPNKTWQQMYDRKHGDGYRGEDIYRQIIKSSQKSRLSTNKYLGIIK